MEISLIWDPTCIGYDLSSIDYVHFSCSLKGHANQHGMTRVLDI